MPPSPDPPTSTDDLQFEIAEPTPSTTPTPSAVPPRTCVVCHRPISSTYFSVAGKIICPICCEKIQAAPAGNPATRFAKATIMGIGAGVVGALIWYAVLKISGYEIGLIAILVGFMVGKSIRKGSGGRGGVGYQLLAVAITYLSVAAASFPIILQAALNRPDTSRQLDIIISLALAIAWPIVGGIKNPIGLLILGFALWQAWKISAGRKLNITGPYQITPNPSAQTTLTTTPPPLPSSPPRAARLSPRRSFDSRILSPIRHLSPVRHTTRPPDARLPRLRQTRPR